MASTLRVRLNIAAITSTDVTIEGSDAADILMLINQADEYLESEGSAYWKAKKAKTALKDAIKKFQANHPKK